MLTVLTTVMAVALVFLLAYLVHLVLLILNMAQSGLLLGVDGIHSFQVSALALLLALVAYMIALYKLSLIRDRRLIDRVVELVSGDHGVLIVRRRMHVKHIVEKQKAGRSLRNPKPKVVLWVLSERVVRNLSSIFICKF